MEIAIPKTYKSSQVKGKSSITWLFIPYYSEDTLKKEKLTSKGVITLLSQPLNRNLKTEEFQYSKFNSLTNLNVVSKIDDYMYHYNENRIQEKLGYLTPKEFGMMAA